MNQMPRIQSFTCPCCRGFIGEAAPVEAVEATLTSATQKAMFRVLSKKPGAPVQRETLMAAMFNHRPDGGPESSQSVFGVTMMRLRGAIYSFGWMIDRKGGGKGGEAVYRLLPIEVSA